MQQTEQVVIEEVEERGAYAQALRMLIRQLLQVVGRQWRIGTVQAHERGANAVACLLVCVGRRSKALCFQYVRGGEVQPRITGKPHPLPRSSVWPTWLQVVTVQSVQPFQQLEEVVSVRLGKQRIG
ncbi:hypothetical protein D9M71_475350 [compost metagenome]